MAGDGAGGSVVVEGTRLDMIERGAGQPLLFLHAENGIEPASAAIEALAKGARVIAPTHPGFGRSELPKGMRSVDDLSYFYLDLLDQLDLLRPHGGRRIARRLACCRDRGEITARMSRLVMANAVGIKVGDRETRDIADIFALTEPEYLDIAYCDPKPAGATTRRCRTARCWPPRAPARRRRASPGIRIFTIHGSKAGCTASASRRCFCGARHDRMLSEAYGRAYCAMIPGARFETDRPRRAFPASGAAKGFCRTRSGVRERQMTKSR